MYTYEEILSKMKEKYTSLTGAEIYDNSDIGIRLKVLAGEIFALYARLDFIEKQSFYATASGEYLDKHANQYGLERKAAAKATGSITFYINEPLDYILYIPAGSVCAAGDSLRYVTTDVCRFSPGTLSATAPAEAEEGGPEYNCTEGTVTTLVSVPAVVSSANNTVAFTGGTETESDEKLRERLIDFCSFLPSGANEEFYKNLAISVEGIGSVSVTSSEAGVVDIYIYGEGEAATTAAYDAVKALCEEKKNVGTTVNIHHATEYPYQIYADVRPDSCSIQTARQAVTEAAAEYFKTLGIGDPVYKSILGAYLLENTPIKNIRFPSALGDYSGSPSTIPVVSDVEVGEM